MALLIHGTQISLIKFAKPEPARPDFTMTGTHGVKYLRLHPTSADGKSQTFHPKEGSRMVGYTGYLKRAALCGFYATQ